MCGRYTLATPAEGLIEAFDVPPPTFDVVPRYNIAPGQLAPVVAADRHGRRMGLMTWGLVPAWAEEPGRGSINARVESVTELPSFREAIVRRRCLVPADGFYEWKREGERKTPYWIHPRASTVISFAGIWERWSKPGAEPLHTFAILTTDANADVASLHDRMPIIVSEGDRDAWLDRDVGAEEALARVRTGSDGVLVSHPVSTRVNKTAEDDAELIERVEG